MLILGKLENNITNLCKISNIQNETLYHSWIPIFVVIVE